MLDKNKVIEMISKREEEIENLNVILEINKEFIDENYKHTILWRIKEKLNFISDLKHLIK